jgi:hypothetical protein
VCAVRVAAVGKMRLVDFVGFEKCASFVKGQHLAIHLELELAGIGGNGDDIAYGVAVGAKDFDECRPWMLPLPA